jgi:hypothetical protein
VVVVSIPQHLNCPAQPAAMALFQLRRTRAAAFVLVATFALAAWASTTTDSKTTSLPSPDTLSLADLDDQLQVRIPSSHPRISQVQPN